MELELFPGGKRLTVRENIFVRGSLTVNVHIESSMAAPLEFAKTVMPHGTTTVIADPHELVNVKGNEAMEYILDATENIPLTVICDDAFFLYHPHLLKPMVQNFTADDMEAMERS